MRKILASFFLLLTFAFLLIAPVTAFVDPMSSPNNPVGIHIISASVDEIKPAAHLVNSTNGDWGYITVLVESKDRDQDKWQKFFNDLRRLHLIPIVRLATQPDSGNWKRPYEGEEEAWAGFLNNLVWPTKNRYVIIYNEPNHGTEWGGSVDPKDYAKTLNKTIDALKKKSDDFFVINAGFDAVAPNQPPKFMDEEVFMKQMNEEVPGIFNKLDGWSSHSYPFAFTGSPSDSGRGTTKTWAWEVETLRSLGVTKTMPIFITETGWKHAEGQSFDRSLPSSATVGDYYEQAFKNSWTNANIIAVTPFLLNYQDTPFDHFSFQKIKTGQSTEYYESYEKVFNLAKVSGSPVQENKAEITKGEIYTSLVSGQVYEIPITFKNTGQSIWGEKGIVRLVAEEGGKELRIAEEEIAESKKIEPGQEHTFNLHLRTPLDGKYKVKLALYLGDTKLDKTWDFYTEIKTPVMLKIKAKLGWKEKYGGDYILSVKGASGNTDKSITLSDAGLSEEIEARYLLPGYKFELTLSKPYYQGVTIERPVISGSNTLDFGTLEPDFGSTLLNPVQFWKLLPFSK